MAKWFLAALIVLSLPVWAAEVADCDSLMAGDRYYGAFVKGLALGALGGAQIEKAIASESPLDPLADERPSVANINTKSALSAMIHDPVVRAAWPKTRERLRALLAERARRDLVRAEARAVTARLLAPTKIMSLPNVPNFISQPVFATLNGRDVVAYIREDLELVISPLQGGTDVLSKPLPDRDKEQWRLGWHRDESGKLWLYAAGVGIQGAARQSGISIFRLDPASEVFTQVPLSSEFANGDPVSFFDLGPDHLLFRTYDSFAGYNQQNQFFQLSGGKFENVTVPLLVGPIPQDAPRGKLFELKMNAGRWYITPSGHKLHFTFDSRNCKFAVSVDGGDEHDLKLNLQHSGQALQDLEIYETPDGTIYLAVTIRYMPDNAKIATYRIDRPDPLQTIPVRTNGLYGLKLFMASHGEVHLATMAADDPEITTLEFRPVESPVPELTMKLPTDITNWSEVGDQIYFVAHGKSGRDIYRVFSHTPGAP